MVSNSTNIKKLNIHLSPQFSEQKRKKKETKRPRLTMTERRNIGRQNTKDSNNASPAL
jgi:hypothetical protein